MRLDQLKCAFGVKFEKFLGYTVNQRDIEANPNKIQALIKMWSLSKPKEVQSLTRRIATLSRLVSQVRGKYSLFFQVLKWWKKFKWSNEFEQAFQGLKDHLRIAPLLAKFIGKDKIMVAYVA